jgi:putative transcriptional regulator
VASKPAGTKIMAITRITQTQLRETDGRYDNAKLAATTEADIQRYMTEDGHDPDQAPQAADIISPWYIRKRLGMTQQGFADFLRIPVATLRNWEQNRVTMEPATVALMRILAKEPEAALRALAA